jgi:hypothetical protein
MDQGRGSAVHTPIGFDLTITSLFPPLLAGRSAALIPEDSTLEALSVALQAGDFSLVKLTPSHLGRRPPENILKKHFNAELFWGILGVWVVRP